MSWLRSIIVCIALGACGFMPVYKKGTSQEALQHVKVEAARDRNAQLFATALEDKLQYKALQAAEYTLTPIITTSSLPLSIEQDGTALRYRITGKAIYSLRDAAGKTVHQGSVERLGSYNISEADFSRYVSEQDAREQVIEGLAEAMRMELIQFFQNRDT